MAVEKGVGFPITATDQFSGAFAKLRGEVSSTSDKLSGLKGIMATITGGIGVAGMVAFIKSTIDAHDEVGKLSQKLGIAVGDLSQLRYAAELSDVSTQSLSAGVKGLSQRLIEAGDKGSQAAGLFKAMGVDIKGGTLPAIEQIADVFAALPDGTTKSALAVQIFGKAGMDLIPMLNDGSAGIRSMREEANKLGGTMSKDATDAAQQFNDNLRAVTFASKGLAITLFSSVAPALLEISQRMKEAAIEGGTFRGILEGMRAAWSEIFLGNPEQNRIAEIRQELALLEPMLEEAPGLAKKVELLNKELSGLLSFMEVGKAGGAKSGPTAVNRKLEERLAGLMGGGNAGKDALQEAERLRKLDQQGWVAYAEFVFREADETNLAIAKSSEEHWAREEKLREEDIKGWVAYAEAVFNEADETNLAIAKINEDGFNQEEGRWSGYIGGIEGAFRQGWDAFTGGAKNAGQVARDALKRTLFDWLWQQFAKPFVLNIVASGANALGISGLGSAATLAGGGGGGILGGLGGLFGSPLGMAVGGVSLAAALYSAFNDGPENENFRWMQGQGGAGSFGGISSSGNYNFNASGLTGIVGGLDRRFEAILGPEGSARATSALAGYTQAGLRMDGQPAQFAFPEGTDAEAAEQLAKELLQSRYGVLFGEIDAELADQVKNFSGTSSELQVFIETMLGVVEGLSGLGIKGLNIDALQAMQKEGEGLGDTFTRVANQWAWFTDNFYTDAEKLDLAQKQVDDTFEALGIAVPKNVTEFRKLVESLDLSTEAGRKFYEMLMGVAPAFLQVAGAADDLGDSSTGAADEVVKSVKRIVTSTAELREEARRAAETLKDAKLGLQDYLGGLLLNDNLSPLTMQQQLEEAKSQFEKTLGLAKGDDLDAVNGLGGSFDAYLALARQIYGSSSEYNAIFQTGFDAIKGVAGGGPSWQSAMQSALPPAGTTMASSADIADLKAEVTKLLSEISQSSKRSAGYSEKTVTELRSGRKGALSS